jgi:uncharacterized protein (TIGR03000 family)
VLGAPGQLHAQGRFATPFNHGFFNSGFNRFGNRSGFGRFVRFEDRLAARLNGGFFNSLTGSGLGNLWAWGLNPYGYGLGGGYGGYGLGGGYGPYGGYGAGSGYGAGGAYGAGSGDYGLSTYAMGSTVPSSDSQQVEVPHRTGDISVAPANAAGIRLYLPDESATVSFNGQTVSSIGTTRTYVTPNLEAGKSLRYEIKVTWGSGDQQTSMEKVVEARAGQIATADFTRVSAR